MAKSYLVTGGSGFIGSALVRRLVHDGHTVRVFDNDSRGSIGRLDDVAGEFEFQPGDIRNPEAVSRAARGMDSICHLAFVNGTEFFYTKPELVLDVGVKGMMNVLDACRSHGVPELVLASSSEVYQTPPIVPTAEDAPLSIPDPTNPRYSYAAGKIISEILALNYGRSGFERVLIFRPHNVYGACMGWEHVVPQFILRMKDLASPDSDVVHFPMQGSGAQTRSFVYIDDFTDGLMQVIEKGAHLTIYHIGTTEEASISTVAHVVGEYFGKRVEIVSSRPALGGTARRCPDISRLTALGYSVKYSLHKGLMLTAKWYDENSHLAPKDWDAGRNKWQA